MSSITKIGSLICLVFVMVGLLFVFSKKNEMSKWNIHLVNIEKRPTRDPKSIEFPYYESSGAILEDMNFFYHLKRTDRTSKNSVAVVEGKKDGRIILNPRHKFGSFKIDYGPIPELSQFNSKTASVLYGIPISSKTIGRNTIENSYKFMAKSVHPRKEVVIDLRFEKSKLIQYRVRSDALKSAWTDV